MPASRLAASICALAGLVGNAAWSATAPAPELAEAQLKEINRHFVGALVARDAGFLAELTGLDFIYTSHGGDWLSRAEFLERMRQPKALEDGSYDNVQVRVFGTVAVLHGLVRVVIGDGNPVQARYTDVYAWDGTRWRLVSVQHTPLKQGVAAQQQVGAASTHVPWQGQDPTGDDLEVLRVLNESYVRAFRAADVAWYDAHLAQDYVVVSGDGSFHDRAAALADFAQPHFATHIKSFPVAHVSIRRYGDVALVRAENAYELKDGRQGINRYTDLWLKQDGRWLCIAAHITVHKAAM